MNFDPVWIGTSLNALLTGFILLAVKVRMKKEDDRDTKLEKLGMEVNTLEQKINFIEKSALTEKRVKEIVEDSIQDIRATQTSIKSTSEAALRELHILVGKISNSDRDR